MALDRVVDWAARWRESAGNPFDRSVLRAYNDAEAEDSTLFMCWSWNYRPTHFQLYYIIIIVFYACEF